MAKDDYEVGRGKPPIYSRFKPGQSGNPSGRPKRAPTIEELVEKELDRVVTRNIEGQTVRMTNRQLAALKLVSQMTRGDIRSVDWFTKRRDRLEALQILEESEPSDCVAADSQATGDPGGLTNAP